MSDSEVVQRALEIFKDKDRMKKVKENLKKNEGRTDENSQKNFKEKSIKKW